MKHNHTITRILAVCLALLFCLSAASAMFVSAKDGFFNDVMVPGTVSDNATRTIGKWTFVPVTIGRTSYAVLVDYLEENPEVVEIPDEVGGYPVLGWGAFCYDAVLKLGQVDFEDMSFFSYLMAMDEITNCNPFAEMQDYELVIPKSFPANLAAVWNANGRSYNEIKTWLERFLNLEFMSCAVSAFSVHPDNAYLQSEGGVLYTKGMTELVKYPIFKESKQFILPMSFDLYETIRKTVIVADGVKVTKHPGDGIMSPFLVYQYQGEKLSAVKPDGKDLELRVHLSDRQMRQTFKQLRKDNKGSPAKRYYKAYVDFSEGLAYYFAGVKAICSDYIHAALTEDIGIYIRNLNNDLVKNKDPKAEKDLLPKDLPTVDLCYGHGNSEMSKSLKRLFRAFTLSFYAWHSILLAAGK